jgi:chaperone required for assembly of F1-ATPase
MKRFYKDVTIVEGRDGLAIELDGRAVRTPARALLALPTRDLAQAVAAEWRAQGDEIDPAAMIFTGLSNAAIDHIAPNPEGFAAGIARYAQSDLLCYRADGPDALVARQAAAWDSLLDWAASRYDAPLVVTQGVIPVSQPEDSLARLEAAVRAHDPFMLAGLSTLVTLSGSLICGLAIVEGGHDPDALWRAVQVDEQWQSEQWGEDSEAAARNLRRAREFSTAGAFCTMSRV